MKKLMILLLCLALALSLTACGGGSEDDAAEPAKEVSAAEEEPAEEPEEEAVPAEEPIQFSPLTVADNDACAVAITELDPDGLWGYTLKAELENRSSDVTYMFAVERGSVNGVECDPFWAQSVGPGKCAFGAISWGSESLEENGIETVEQIEFHLSAHDEEDFSGGGYIDQTVTLTP